VGRKTRADECEVTGASLSGFITKPEASTLQTDVVACMLYHPDERPSRRSRLASEAEPDESALRFWYHSRSQIF
jgi:hypothetical protein